MRKLFFMYLVASVSNDSSLNFIFKVNDQQRFILITPLLAAGLCGQQPTPVPAAAKPAARPAPPQRDPNSPGYVKAKELPDGAVPSPQVELCRHPQLFSQHKDLQSNFDPSSANLTRIGTKNQCHPRCR